MILFSLEKYAGSQALLANGMRWKVADGSSINVWHDPWLRDLDNPMVETPMITSMEDFLVKDLITNFGTWDVDLINSILTERDVKQMLSIPLCRKAEKDKQIWSHAKNGIYSVKVWYHMMMNNVFDTYDYSVQGDWKKLWGLHIPPKVKCFLWRATRDVFPTQSKLHSKGISVPINCPRCANDIENSLHIFINCSHAQGCWTETGLNNVVNNFASKSHDFASWFFQVLAHADVWEMGRIAVILWQIWRSRNEKV